MLPLASWSLSNQRPQLLERPRRTAGDGEPSKKPHHTCQGAQQPLKLAEPPHLSSHNETIPPHHGRVRCSRRQPNAAASGIGPIPYQGTFRPLSAPNCQNQIARIRVTRRQPVLRRNNFHYDSVERDGRQENIYFFHAVYRVRLGQPAKGRAGILLLPAVSVAPGSSKCTVL